MQKFNYFFVFLILGCNLSYAPTTPHLKDSDIPNPQTIPQIQMLISPRLGSYFPNFEKLQYTNSEILPLLDSMQEKSDKVCKMLYNQAKFDKQYVESYTKLGFTGPVKEKFYLNTVKRIIAGCWNFYQMNDLKPEKDFEHIKNLYSDKIKDCYSVGFMQPYIMHNTIGCNKLTMLDMDWRILHGHSQILKGFQENQFSDETTAQEFLKTLRLGWIVGTKFHSNPSVSIDDLCLPLSKKDCLNHLVSFQKKFKSIQKIHLYLSTIHEANLRPEKGSMSIVFLSNAFEDYYTKHREFNIMMDYLKTNLEESETVSFIYHVGGRHNYGIYETKKKSEKLEVSAICKDQYYFFPITEGREKYTIHFDRLKELKPAKQTCTNVQVSANKTAKAKEEQQPKQ
jgi:hypothetical protein